ncbi:MAG: class I SAM-dependent methyltransferase [Actinomycetota bacterium]|jgi:ubiquinone/menaquinone biosynthesis C-methylase UbiE|nr:class I SAM-dependent methyltransferase [Actinomycetota bacterium]
MATRSADAGVWDERYNQKDLVWSIGPNEFVERHLGGLKPGTAIDLAAGEGRNALWFASLGWSVAAVDFSAVAIERGRRLGEERGVTGVEWVVGDALAWEPSMSVDLVVVSYLQLPGEQRLAAIRRAASWVKPGGTFFVIAHDQSNVESGHGGPQAVEVCWTPDEVVAELDGFEVSVAEVAERVVDTDDGPEVALDTLVVATKG